MSLCGNTHLVWFIHLVFTLEWPGANHGPLPQAQLYKTPPSFSPTINLTLTELQLTQWRLQHASILLTVANGLDLSRVHQPPEVVLVVAAVEAQAQAGARQPHHGGDAGGRGVPGVLGLQLHTDLELVCRWSVGLKMSGMGGGQSEDFANECTSSGFSAESAQMQFAEG